MISSLIHLLNADSELYDKLVRVQTAMSKASSVGESSGATENENTVFLADLRREFESEGIHLSTPKRAELHDIQVVQYSNDILFVMSSFPQGKLVSAESEYSGNITGQSSDLYAIDLSNVDLEPLTGDQLRDWAASNGIEQFNVGDSLVANHAVADYLINHAPSSELRRRLWIAQRVSAYRNIPALGSIVQLRQKAALLTGFKSHAHKALANKVHRDPEAVWQLLLDTNKAIRRRVDEEHAVLTSIIGLDRSDSIPLWDLPFVMTAAKSSTADSPALLKLSQYFPIKRCIAGFQMICEEVFGVRVEAVPFEDGEAWVDGSQVDSLLKLKVTPLNRSSQAGEGGPIGTLYLDLFARPNKYSHAAHFNIQSRCRNVVRRTSTGGDFQPAVVGLVFNFHNRDENGSGDKMSWCLSYSELQTLFHELGHALNSVLSRTHYQHLAGTRGPLDIVEVICYNAFEATAETAAVGAVPFI
jgi:Zn-dependent oligopeptidase